MAEDIPRNVLPMNCVPSCLREISVKTCFYDILVTYLDLQSRPGRLELVDINQMRPRENTTSTDCVGRSQQSRTSYNRELSICK